MIDGVRISPLKQFSSEAGRVMHMLRNDSEVFEVFGEIYFSTIYPGAIKGWHHHEKTTINYAVPQGAIRLVIYDDRTGSTTKGKIDQISLSPEAYQLVTVPAKLWYGFQCIGSETAIVANCATLPHDPEESSHRELSDSTIPFDWSQPAP
ncbi:MAG: dTDP-4-dehydrorhamnose 3,5-epimerase family protein [Proteobacteria bacterium]|nr:dTDP-4-dehydrorhamnose 3,5-epimerase family protein [Pseudomonadota bacterium]